MAPKYKLTYFNLTGLGEPIRYIFAYGNIDYEDIRIEFADWPKYKSNTLFGKVPMLEFDGKVVHQSAAICRYLGKQLGIAGKDDFEALQADAIVDTLTDFRSNASSYIRETDETKKAAILEEIKTVHAPFYLERFDKIIADNGGYFVNGQLTWADLFFSAYIEHVSTVFKDDILSKYTNVKQLMDKVANLPGIKEHRAKRPQTSH